MPTTPSGTQDDMKRKRLLVVAGGPEAKWQSRKSLNPELYDVEFIGSRDLALQRIQRQPVPDAVVLTIQRGGSDMDCVALFRQAGPSSKIITLCRRTKPTWWSRRSGW